MDGIDRLLQIVAYYRRRQPQSPEASKTLGIETIRGIANITHPSS